MRVRQPRTVLPMNIYAFQIKSHRRFIFSFTPLFGQFGWSALLTFNLYAVCVRFAWFYLTVAKWKILYQLDWFVFCILYHVWKTNDAHIFHTGIFFPSFYNCISAVGDWCAVCLSLKRVPHSMCHNLMALAVRLGWFCALPGFKCLVSSFNISKCNWFFFDCMRACTLSTPANDHFSGFCSLSFLIQYSWTKSIVA